MPLSDGEVFAGYRIGRLLGTGGMGEVYQASHPRLPRQEALKVLPAGLSSDVAYRRRFEREADIASSLWHPHIVAVHDRGEQNGQLWIAMDYVDGTDLSRLMRDKYPNGMSRREVCEIMSAIADALDYAHSRQLLHRDVKPANILTTDPRVGERRIMLADFGIARDVNDANGLTATNMALGTVAYAAPEQLSGQILDGRADQYALACTAFHLLTGSPPFADSNAAVVIGQHLSAPRPRIGARRPDLSVLDEVLLKAMDKEPAGRFESCRAFAAALTDRGLGSAPTQEAPRLPPPHRPAPHPTPRRMPPGPVPPPPGAGMPRRSAVVGGAVAGLLAVGLVAFIGARLAQPGSTPAAGQTTATTRYGQQTYGVPADPEDAPTSHAPPNPDLGLSIPLSHPPCDGSGVVIVGSVTTPGLYKQGVQNYLDSHPGASYLRTDQSCTSLRQVSDEGNPIYAVYFPAGRTQQEICDLVHIAGDGAYGKWMDMRTDPHFVIPC